MWMWIQAARNTRPTTAAGAALAHPLTGTKYQANRGRPRNTAAYTLISVEKPEKYTISIAARKLSGAQNCDQPSRNGRYSRGAYLRNTGRPTPPMMEVSAVVEVMKPTSLYQLGSGTRNTQPMTSATIVETHGTRQRLTTCSARGAIPCTLRP